MQREHEVFNLARCSLPYAYVVRHENYDVNFLGLLQLACI